MLHSNNLLIFLKVYSSVIAFITNLLEADCVGNARFCGLVLFCENSFDLFTSVTDFFLVSASRWINGGAFWFSGSRDSGMLGAARLFTKYPFLSLLPHGQQAELQRQKSEGQFKTFGLVLSKFMISCHQNVWFDSVLLYISEGEGSFNYIKLTFSWREKHRSHNAFNDI